MQAFYNICSKFFYEKNPFAARASLFISCACTAKRRSFYPQGFGRTDQRMEQGKY
jgi:hypothetical protein